MTASSKSTIVSSSTTIYSVPPSSLVIPETVKSKVPSGVNNCSSANSSPDSVPNMSEVSSLLSNIVSVVDSIGIISNLVNSMFCVESESVNSMLREKLFHIASSGQIVLFVLVTTVEPYVYTQSPETLFFCR